MWADIDLGFRVVFVVVFATAAAGKLRNRSAFLSFAASVRVVMSGSGVRSRTVASVVVGAECSVVALVALPGTTVVGFAVAALLLVIFATGISRALATGARVTCRCFGREGAVLSRSHLIRNGLLGLFALIGIYAHLQEGPERVTLTHAFAPAALGVLVGVAFTAWDELAFLLTGGRGPTLKTDQEVR